MRKAGLLASVLFSSSIFALDATQLPKTALGGDPVAVKVNKSGIARVKLTVNMPNHRSSTAWVGLEATWRSPTSARNVRGGYVRFDNRWHYLFYVHSANANMQILAYARKRTQRVWRWTLKFCKLWLYAYPKIGSKYADASVNIVKHDQSGSISDILIRPYESLRRGYKLYESPEVVCQ